jgi:membrane protein implicated in regulation of membrane protease activity
LAKPLIQPIFILPSSVMAAAPFHYLWNHPLAFAAQNFWLALLTPVVVFFVLAIGLACLMTVVWRLWVQAEPRQE